MAKAEYRETGAARHISLDHPLSAADWFVALFISFFKLMWMIMMRMIIPDICHEPTSGARENFFWPV